MKTYFVIYPLVFLSILNACDADTTSSPKEKITDISTLNMTPQQVLEAHLAKFPLFKDASIVRVPDLDIAEYTAFSATPKSTGRAAQVFYLVKGQEVLSSGSNTLDVVMKQLIASNETLNVHEFAALFLRFKVVRYGVVLETRNGHALMEPEQLSESDFSIPSMNKEDNDFHYSFWIFDVDGYVAVYYDILVHNDGQIEYDTKELE